MLTLYKIGVRTSRVYLGKKKKHGKRDYFFTKNAELAKRFQADATRSPREEREPTLETIEYRREYYDSDADFKEGEANFHGTKTDFETEEEYKAFLDNWCNKQAIAGRFD